MRVSRSAASPTSSGFETGNAAAARDIGITQDIRPCLQIIISSSPGNLEYLKRKPYAPASNVLCRIEAANDRLLDSELNDTRRASRIICSGRAVRHADLAGASAVRQRTAPDCRAPRRKRRAKSRTTQNEFAPGSRG